LSGRTRSFAGAGARRDHHRWGPALRPWRTFRVLAPLGVGRAVLQRCGRSAPASQAQESPDPPYQLVTGAFSSIARILTRLPMVEGEDRPSLASVLPRPHTGLVVRDPSFAVPSPCFRPDRRGAVRAPSAERRETIQERRPALYALGLRCAFAAFLLRGSSFGLDAHPRPELGHPQIFRISGADARPEIGLRLASTRPGGVWTPAATFRRVRRAASPTCARPLCPNPRFEAGASPPVAGCRRLRRVPLRPWV